MDVLADLTQPVAFGFLTRFLGVADTDAKRFFSWSHAVAQFMLQPHAEEAAVRRGVEAFAEIRTYVEAQIDDRLSTGSTDDVLGLLAATKDREGLSLDEITAKIGRASCRERVCTYVSNSEVAVSLNKKKKPS